MVEVNYIFGVNRFVAEHTDTVKLGYMVDAQGLEVKTGAPCLICGRKEDKVNLSSRLGQNINPRRFVIAPFPTGYRFHPRCLLDTHSNSFAIKEFGDTDFLNNIKTIETPSIDPNKLTHAVNHVKEKGPLTFLIDEKKQIQSNLISVISKLSKTFKHRCLLFHESRGACTLQKNEKILFALSMIDVRQCMPIFNPDKVDGIILHGAVIYPERSKHDDRLYASTEFFMLFSKFKENFDTNGSTGRYQFVSGSDLIGVVKALEKHYASIGKVGTSNEIKMKSKGPKKASCEDSIAFISGNVGSGTSTYSSYASTTTGWSSTS